METATSLRVSIGRATYPAEEIARGAAYEILSAHEQPGFAPCARGWHRYVHASEVSAVHGPAQPDIDGLDQPLLVPLSRTRGWQDVHRLTQTARGGGDPLLAAIRATAQVRRGSRMVKVLSPRQVVGYLRGWLPSGFCYREYDIAHLRTPAELNLLRTDSTTHPETGDVAFALRWRAVDGSDYEVPTVAAQGGLVAMPPHDRVGAPVLGTGFTPSDQYVIPEFVTADMVDLPMPANATLLAYTADGTEIVLYAYQPEQRGWLRMVGARWRHLLHGLGDARVDQEYVPVSVGQGAEPGVPGQRQRPAVVPPQRQGQVPAPDLGTSRLIGWFRGQEYDAVADPPDEFRLLAMSRAARYPVEALSRRTRYATWRGARCTVVRDDGAWARVRLCRPGPDHVAALGAQCHERGVYETWAPAAELTGRAAVDHPYTL